MQVHIGSEADNHVTIRVLGKPESRDLSTAHLD